MKEYYENKSIFSDALAKYGSHQTLLQGASAVAEKNITKEVINYIFAIHRTKMKIRQATLKALSGYLNRQ